MKHSIATFAIAATLGAIAIAGVSVAATPTIGIVASNWKFTPSTIQLHVGQTTTLRLSSTQGVHGIESADLGIAQTTIQPGSVKSIEVTPKKTGQYVLHCAVFCGAGHANMTLTINVVQ